MTYIFYKTRIKFNFNTPIEYPCPEFHHPTLVDESYWPTFSYAGTNYHLHKFLCSFSGQSYESQSYFNFSLHRSPFAPISVISLLQLSYHYLPLFDVQLLSSEVHAACSGRWLNRLVTVSSSFAYRISFGIPIISMLFFLQFWLFLFMVLSI